MKSFKSPYFGDSYKNCSCYEFTIKRFFPIKNKLSQSYKDQHILTKQPSDRFQNVIQQVVFFYCESDSLSNISSISKPIFVPILSFNSVKEVSYNFEFNIAIRILSLKLSSKCILALL